MGVDCDCDCDCDIKPTNTSTTVQAYTKPCGQPVDKAVDNSTQENEDFKSIAQTLDGWNLSKKTKPIKPEEPLDDYSPNLNSSTAFSRFWQKYPRKQGELEAKIAWTEATGERNIIPGDLIRAADKYAAASSTKDRQYIPMPANFIRKLLWMEYIPKALPNCGECGGKGVVPADGERMAICGCNHRYHGLKSWH